MTDPGTEGPDLTQTIQSAVYNAFNTDEFSDSQAFVPFTHEKVHEGNAYDATHEYSSVAGDGSVTATISVPSTINAAHIRAKQWTPSNESIRVELFRNPTIDTAPLSRFREALGRRILQRLMLALVRS